MGDHQRRNQRFRKSPLQLGIGQYMSQHDISNIARSIMNKGLECGCTRAQQHPLRCCRGWLQFCISAAHLGNILLQYLKVFTRVNSPTQLKSGHSPLPPCMASLCTQKLSEHILNFIKKSIFLVRRDDDEHRQLPFLSCGGKLLVLELQTTGDEMMDTGQS